MQPMPGQSVAQQPVHVQAVPAQGHMPINMNTGKEEKEWGIFTPTPAEMMTGIFVVLGLLSWMCSYWAIDVEDPSMGMIYFCQGLAYTFWFGAIVSAVHSVEKALLNSKK
jgi:hypothetical protein|tara:strand:+ start:126 stop:455 length:330 start_codon:yes stop_codon:yes gene_type:complete